MKSMGGGSCTPATKAMLLTREAEEAALNTSIACHEIQKTSLTRDQIIYWLYTFRDGNVHNEDFRLELTSTFINSVYVDEKKVVIVYNYCDDSHSTALRPDVGSDTFAEMKHGGFEPPTT